MNKVMDTTKIKIDLWKDINSHINKIEDSYPFFFTLFVTFFSGLLVFLNTSGKSILSKNFTVYILCFVPIAISIVMAYLSYNFRWVAIARMYASALEKSINEELDEDIFLWNSDIVDNFMANNNFTNTKLLPIINALLFLCVAGFLIVTMYKMDISMWWKGLYIVMIIALFSACVAPLCYNKKIRTFKYKLKIHDEKNVTKLLHKNKHKNQKVK